MFQQRISTISAPFQQNQQCFSMISARFQQNQHDFSTVSAHPEPKPNLPIMKISKKHKSIKTLPDKNFSHQHKIHNTETKAYTISQNLNLSSYLTTHPSSTWNQIYLHAIYDTIRTTSILSQEKANNLWLRDKFPILYPRFIR